MKMKKNIRLSTILLLCSTLLFAGLFAWKSWELQQLQTSPAAASAVFEDAPSERAAGFHDRYALEQMVVLSRHNIRSPLSGNGSALASLTPYTWFDWTSDPSDLSLRGGTLETMMGQFFRKWLASEGLMSENEIPAEGQVRFYANSMQRTIATAQYFSSGFLPAANVEVEHHMEIGTMDPVFTPQLTFMNDAYRAKALAEISAMGGEAGLQGIGQGLAPDYQLLAEVLDLKDSAKAKDEGFTQFATDDLAIVLEENKEPGLTGSLKPALQASDALVLQYYEDSDPVHAAFGHRLTEAQWEQIAHIKDVYTDVLFTAPSVAAVAAHPLLQEMQQELSRQDRQFAFLCGHDSNVASVLSALQAEPYELPQAIEKKTPIGVKLVIEKWLGQDGQEYASLSLVYQSVDQLRNRTELSLEQPPMLYHLSLQGLEKNADGLYQLSEVQQRFTDAISEYDTIKSECGAGS